MELLTLFTRGERDIEEGTLVHSVVKEIAERIYQDRKDVDDWRDANNDWYSAQNKFRSWLDSGEEFSRGCLSFVHYCKEKEFYSEMVDALGDRIYES